MAASALTRRQRAALPGSGLDGRVRLLKRLLPLAAAVVLAAVIALTLRARDETSFVLARDRVGSAPERLRVLGATYRGADARGRPFSVRAGSAVQRSSATPVVEIARLTADIALDGGPARITAPSGRFEIEADRLVVDGPVAITQARYRIDSGQLAIDLARQTAVSQTSVTGATPLGTFEAARMSADVPGERIVLDGGARLRIARRQRR